MTTVVLATANPRLVDDLGNVLLAILGGFVVLWLLAEISSKLMQRVMPSIPMMVLAAIFGGLVLALLSKIGVI